MGSIKLSCHFSYIFAKHTSTFSIVIQYQRIYNNKAYFLRKLVQIVEINSSIDPSHIRTSGK